MKNSGISDFNIWISADNLFLLTKRQGFNPTTSESGGTGRYGYPPLTNVTAGIRLKF
jgi:hypothetical protein